MEPTIYIAKILAVLYLSVGLGAVLDKHHLKKIVDNYIKNEGAAFVASLFALLVGFGILYVHNTWTADWKSLITFIGWAGIIKGVLGLIFPGYFVMIGEYFSKIKNLYIIAGPVCLILGLIFGYYGFLA